MLARMTGGGKNTRIDRTARFDQFTLVNKLAINFIKQLVKQLFLHKQVAETANGRMVRRFIFQRETRETSKG